MAWSNTILYMTMEDAGVLRKWINAEDSVAWIILDSRSGNKYRWRAVDRIDAINSQHYSIWFKDDKPLLAPSGRKIFTRTKVADPFAGWTQILSSESYTAPWFGDELPGPFSLVFRENGKEAANSIGRSELIWPADDYRSIGKPANPDAKKWWQRLQRFIRKQSTAIPWPYPAGSGRSRAYAFPDAYEQIRNGRHADVNP